METDADATGSSQREDHLDDHLDDADTAAGAGVDEDVDPDDDLTVVDEEYDDLPVSAAARGGGSVRRFSLREWTPAALLQAAHPKQAAVTALAVAGVAVLTGREPREVGVIAVTVLVGQAILGWHNDIVDRARDQDHHLGNKPVADGRLSPGNAWYAIVVAVLLLVPLSITTGITAGCLYLGSVAIAMLGNVVLRTGLLSWWSWAASFALLPAYLSYGGWGGQAEGSPPETSIVVLAALLGVGVHVTRAVYGLVADHADGWTYLPLKLGLRLGATRLLALATVWNVVIVVLLGYFGARDGLTR